MLCYATHADPCHCGSVVAAGMFFSDVIVFSVASRHGVGYIVTDAYDLVPKGAQEKRTEVLENKVDRM